jgi:hypothetical protein
MLLDVGEEVLHCLEPFLLQHFSGLFASVGIIVAFMIHTFVLDSRDSVT